MSACTNCDDAKCMGCVLREPRHDCANDCPECCETPNPGVELTPQEALRVTTVVLDLTDKLTQYQLALRQARRQLELFMADGERNRLTVTLVVLEKALDDKNNVGPLDEYRGQ